MKRHFKHFLDDIIEYSNITLELTQNMTFEDFEKDLKTFLATTRTLEIIGEAINHIPDEIKRKYFEIPWHQIQGFRNTVIHEYFGIDKEIVWNTARKNTIFLIEQISKIILDLKKED